MRMLNQYRLLVIVALAAIYYLGDDNLLKSSVYPGLFIIVHASYLLITLIFVCLNRALTTDVTTYFFVQNYFDIIIITALMFSSGGISNGLGPLLLINIALLSQLSSVRHALLFAAISSIFVIGEEMLMALLVDQKLANFEATALLGALLFLTAWLMTVPLRNLLSRQLAHPSRTRAVLDVQQIAQLNEEIIRELDSGVLVVDRTCYVQMMNDTARVLLAAEFTYLPIHLRKLSIDLLQNMRESETSPTLQTRPFDISSTGQAILPHYTRLSTGGMLIRLDDHAQIRQQFQQLKLASLGRLSASIAHEIRNPLGAISHAVQLIEESANLDSQDAGLLNIARRNTQRINRIIEDVLQLSNRQRVQLSVVSIDEAIERFALRFTAENPHTNTSLNVSAAVCFATVDADHRDQILWNLCTNAALHNDKQTIVIDIVCFYSGQGTTIIDVKDNGTGISDFERDKLFEPFYSTHHAGTGLGLFIIRELCELNNSSIEHVSSDTGAHFRLTLISAQDMAA